MEILLLLGLPLAGCVALAFFGARRYAPELNAATSLATLAAAVLLTVRVTRYGPLTAGGEQFYVDSFNIFLVALTAFVGFTTAVFSRPYMRAEQRHRKLSARRLRLYHSMYQLFMGAMLMALTTNNLGLLWVAMEAATLSTVLLVSLYKTRASLEAAWKYFILCGVGIAQALFGTILLYFAAARTLGHEGMSALLWTHLYAVRAELEPRVVALAFVFLLVGYGTKVGLAPLHNWLPDAHSEAPAPVSAVLSGLLLNVGLYAVMRAKTLAAASIGSVLPGRALMAFGLISALLGALFLWRQRDIKRLFGYSSIEHMGIITFAFGLGGPVANFAALLHMTVHSLTKSSVFFTAGHAAQTAGTQQMDEIRGLVRISPALGWGLLLGSLAILGMPPFGLFTSEFLILTTAMRADPWATPLLLLVLAIAFAGIFSKVQPMAFGESAAPRLPHSSAVIPVYLHLALVLTLGLYIPPALAACYHAAAQLIG